MIVHTRLLLLSCSQRKRPDPEMLPAIERYDGPFFRVLRRYQQGITSTNVETKPSPDILILSAEYGLIAADEPITNYERRMTVQRAKELRFNVLTHLRSILNANASYKEMFLCMGREYRRALEGWETWKPAELAVVEAEGSIGRMQAQLHDWLYGKSPSRPSNARNGVARIRGIKVDLTPEEVLEVARKALSTNGKNAANFHTWYVRVNDRRVAPKWLVSQLTGLPVGAFVTDEARRLLAQLGVIVERI